MEVSAAALALTEEVSALSAVLTSRGVEHRFIQVLFTSPWADYAPGGWNVVVTGIDGGNDDKWFKHASLDAVFRQAREWADGDVERAEIAALETVLGAKLISSNTHAGAPQGKETSNV